MLRKFWAKLAALSFETPITLIFALFFRTGADQCPQLSFTHGKNSKHYPRVEPSSFGVAVGDANHYTF
jgi:hypothetical protein